jgi:GT2 family glycosyltransferase
MLVRGELLDQVGLLDEAFFMYGEDLDWAFRIKQKGWQVYYNGAVHAIHVKGASSSQRSTKSIIAFYKAMLTFYQKHYAATTPLPLGCAVIAGIYAKGGLALLRNALNRKRSSTNIRFS